jgi:hypothetical protein
MRKHIIAISLLSTLFFLFATCLTCYAQGEAVYGCAKKKGGYLRIVTDPSQCKSNETAVTMNQGSTDTGGIKVYDANGQYLGFLLDFASSNYDEESYTSIFIPSLKKGIDIRRTDYDTGDDLQLGNNLRGDYFNILFESDNCTGTGFIDRDSERFSANHVFGRNQGQYYTVKPLDRFTINPRSRLWFQEEGYGCSNMYPSYPTETYEAIKIDLPFTLPIALPLMFEQISPTYSKPIITPSQETINNPSVGNFVTYTISGGIPPYTVQALGNYCYPGGECVTVPESFTGNTFNVNVTNVPTLGVNTTVTIVVIDSAKKVGTTTLLLTTPNVPPLMIEPSTTQTISNPQVGSSVSYTISGGNGIYSVNKYTYTYPDPGYISVAVSGSTATATVVSVPETDTTYYISIYDSHGSSWQVQLVLDVSQLAN